MQRVVSGGTEERKGKSTNTTLENERESTKTKGTNIITLEKVRESTVNGKKLYEDESFVLVKNKLCNSSSTDDNGLTNKWRKKLSSMNVSTIRSNGNEENTA